MLPLEGIKEVSDDKFLQAVLDTLRAMQPAFVDLSHLKWGGIDNPRLMPFFLEQRVQERPFAYEFYHQFRKLWEDGRITALGYGHTTTQAEVHKGYQDIPRLKKMPDLLVYRAGGREPSDQVAVLEFKLATNKAYFQDDFDKLIDFRQFLAYQYGIEIIIGNEAELRSAQNYVANNLTNPNQYHWQPITLHVIYFEREQWRAMIEEREYK